MITHNNYNKDNDFYEHGTLSVTPTSAKSQKLNQLKLLNDAKVLTLEELAENGVNVLHHLNAILKVKLMYPPTLPTNPVMSHQWIYGPTGTGKSRTARTEHPEAYIKAKNKWWDGYQNESSVILDDITEDDAKWIHSFLLNWADHYPFRAETKGSSLMIRPKVIVITSNYHPSDLWLEKNKCDPILRRFTLRQML